MADITVLDDEDLNRDLSAETAVNWCREAILAAHRGELLAPPRVHADLGDGRLAYTAGRLAGRWFGYRSYDTLPETEGEQNPAHGVGEQSARRDRHRGQDQERRQERMGQP